MVRIGAIMRGVINLFLCLALSTIVWADEKPVRTQLDKGAVERNINEVILNGKMLSVNLRSIPLEQVLGEIEKKTRLSFGIDSGLFKEKVSCQFSDLSVEEGIKRILHRYSLFVIYDESGELSRIYVLGKGERTSESGKSAFVASPPVEPKTIAQDAESRAAEDSLPPGADEEPGKPLEFKPREKVPPPSKDESKPEDFGLKKNVPPPGAEGKACSPLKFEGKEKLAPPRKAN